MEAINEWNIGRVVSSTVKPLSALRWNPKEIYSVQDNFHGSHKWVKQCVVSSTADLLGSDGIGRWSLNSDGLLPIYGWQLKFKTEPKPETIEPSSILNWQWKNGNCFVNKWAQDSGINCVFLNTYKKVKVCLPFFLQMLKMLGVIPITSTKPCELVQAQDLDVVSDHWSHWETDRSG